MQTWLLFTVFTVIILFVNALTTIRSQEGKGDRRTFILGALLSLAFVLCSFTVVNYEYVSTLIKECLSTQQIEMVRSLAESLTGGGGVLCLLQVCSSQLFLSVIAVAAVLGTHKRLVVQQEEPPQRIKKSIPSIPTKNPDGYVYFYPLTAIKFNS